MRHFSSLSSFGGDEENHPQARYAALRIPHSKSSKSHIQETIRNIFFEFDSYESVIYACLFPNIAKEQPDVLDVLGIYLNLSDALNFDGRSLSARKLPGLNTCPSGFRVGKELF